MDTTAQIAAWTIIAIANGAGLFALVAFVLTEGRR